MAADPSPRGRLLGIDYGRVRIGLAVSDALGIGATPLGFIRRESDQQAAAVVAGMARREAVVGLVIGLPLHEDGRQGGNVTWVRDFAAALRRICPLPIHETDERYSSAEAEAALRDAGKWPCDPGWLDAQAAAILLRRHLRGDG
jgi:putative Holliday junction resolvase